MSSRLMKSWSVLGAERDGDVRMRMECSLTWAVNLLKMRLENKKRNYLSRIKGNQIMIKCIHIIMHIHIAA